MRKQVVRLLIFMVGMFFANELLAHEDHHHSVETDLDAHYEGINKFYLSSENQNLVASIGSYHLILLHFPFALINIALLSQILSHWFRKPIFDNSAQFNLYAAAILTLPTIVLGVIYSYSAPYEGMQRMFLWWHMVLGLITAFVALLVAWIRYTLGSHLVFYMGLILLFLLVNTTAYFGAKMSFGW